MKAFKFTATIEIDANDQKEAEEIIQKIQDEGEFPDGSIVTDNFNILAWRKIN